MYNVDCTNNCKKEQKSNIMNRIRLLAPGKVNWTLNVTGRRPDGYHDVEMLMQSIDLSDEVILEESMEEVTVESDSEDIPLDGRNIAVKAAYLLKEAFPVKKGVHIIIRKNIPVAAGLAGGSTDAAAVLTGLDRLWDLGLSTDELAAFGARLGADVPFCITGGTAIARGIGEKLTFLPPVTGMTLVLVKPPFGISTASVYKAYSVKAGIKRPDVQAVYRSLADRDWTVLPGYMFNVLEQVTLSWHPEIDDIKNALLQHGAQASLMSGSGPTVYGVFKEPDAALHAFAAMKDIYPMTYLSRTVDHGAVIL